MQIPTGKYDTQRFDSKAACPLRGTASPPSRVRYGRVAVRLLAGSKEPGGLDLGTLRQHKSILHVDAKISHGVLDLGMAE
jgi:hypothetical protein